MNKYTRPTVTTTIPAVTRDPDQMANQESPGEHEKAWMRQWRELLEFLCLVQDEAEADHLMRRLVKADLPTTLAFVNAHAMNCAVADKRFHAGLLATDCLCRDGTGLAILFKLLGRHAGLNMNGTDFIPHLIKQFPGREIALFGTQEPFLGKAATAVRESLAPGSNVQAVDGFLSDDNEYLKLASHQRPALIVLGMGMPKQERLAALLRSELKHPCLIICGGAILDFIAGRVPRAPKWMRQLGIEWVYRLLKEPRRLFRRYLVGNPIFLIRAFLYSARQRSQRT
jgi:N-acetylglucosaminyldiphosphoundecaprenol N-acetyl-beta-D-mannosaminyltransferase